MRAETGRIRVAVLAGAALMAAILLGWAGPAAAHETEQPYLYVFVTEGGVDGRAELSVNDVAEVLGLDLSGDDRAVEAALRAAEQPLHTFLADHLDVGTGDDGAWELEFGRIDLFRESGSLAFAVVQYRAVDAEGLAAGADLAVRFDPFLDDGARDGLVLVTGGFEDGVFDPDREFIVAVTGDDPVVEIDLGGDGGWGKFRSGVTLGIEHIETGPDHVLFVLVLLLPSVLVYAGGWRPAPGFLASLWRVLKIATFFTLAHSITFTLAGMGWLPLPPAKLTETIIAASIAAAALHNIRPILPNREWALAFGFGLFHGMGFASLVAGLDVSRSSQLISLLGRNVGIEIGQVVVILLLFPALFLLRRTPAYQPVLQLGSIALAVVAIGWMVERLFETDLGTNGLVEWVVATPTGYLVAAGLTAAALAVHLYAARTRRLIEPLDS